MRGGPTTREGAGKWQSEHMISIMHAVHRLGGTKSRFLNCLLLAGPPCLHFKIFHNWTLEEKPICTIFRDWTPEENFFWPSETCCRVLKPPGLNPRQQQIAQNYTKPPGLIRRISVAIVSPRRCSGGWGLGEKPTPCLLFDFLQHPEEILNFFCKKTVFSKLHSQ